ncbi:MAG: hypothetical protein ABR584_00090 [Candidatus Baltobacteraceae bacterium]
MIFARYFVFALIVLALGSPAARADALPASGFGQVVIADDEDRNDNDVETQGHDRGVLDGDIAGVDYARGILHVQTARRGRVDVVILPSTNIMRRGDQYGTIADLAQGAHISVYVSEVAGRLTAQIIRIH